MSLSPEHAHSMIAQAPGLGAVASRMAYQVRSLRFQYHPLSRGAANWVLDGLTFDVDAGEILGIVGPNGSGKTSLLKLMAKVLRHMWVTWVCSGALLARCRKLRWQGLWPLYLKKAPRSFPLP